MGLSVNRSCSQESHNEVERQYEGEKRDEAGDPDQRELNAAGALLPAAQLLTLHRHDGPRVVNVHSWLRLILKKMTCAVLPLNPDENKTTIENFVSWAAEC